MAEHAETDGTDPDAQRTATERFGHVVRIGQGDEIELPQTANDHRQLALVQAGVSASFALRSKGRGMAVGIEELNRSRVRSRQIP